MSRGRGGRWRIPVLPAELSTVLAQHAVDLVGEFEDVRQPATTAEAWCARDRTSWSVCFRSRNTSGGYAGNRRWPRCEGGQDTPDAAP